MGVGDLQFEKPRRGLISKAKSHKVMSEVVPLAGNLPTKLGNLLKGTRCQSLASDAMIERERRLETEGTMEAMTTRETNGANSIEEGDMRVKLPFFLLHESKKDDHEVRVTREDACREGVSWRLMLKD